MLPHRDFEQEKCGKPQTRNGSPDGGSDPVALEPTDEPSHRQRIRNPVWSGLTNGTGIAGRCDRSPISMSRTRRTLGAS